MARVEIGVETGRISLNLEVPLLDLVGFERAPRTDAERAAVTAALARLRDADKLVRIDRAAGCGSGKVGLTAPVWGVDASGGLARPAAAASASAEPAASAAAAKAPTGGVARDAHGDVEASYEFRCSDTPRAAHLELGFFDAFVRLRRIEVQAVSPRGQMKMVLRRPQARIGLAR